MLIYKDHLDYTCKQLWVWKCWPTVILVVENHEADYVSISKWRLKFGILKSINKYQLLINKQLWFYQTFCNWNTICMVYNGKQHKTLFFIPWTVARKKKHIQILLSGLLIKDIVWRILDRLNTKQERSDIHATPNGGVKFARAND